MGTHISINGRVATGVGQGRRFTQLDWARRQFVDGLGIEPWPGTLNLVLAEKPELERWRELAAQQGIPIVAPEPDQCDARCYPVTINESLHGAVVLPEVPAYPPQQVEIICALPLRSTLDLSDGSPLRLDFRYQAPVRAILFDVDGTLVDSLEGFRVVAEMAAAARGYSVTREAVRDALNTPGTGFWELIVPTAEDDRESVIAELRQAAQALWPKVLHEHVSLIGGVSEHLAKLHERGYRLGIVTGSDGHSLTPLDDAGLLDLFDTVVTASDVDQPKPEPDGLHHALEELAVAAEDAVYVGDTALDIRASHAAGLRSIGVLSGAGDSARLSAEGPDALLRGVAGLFALLEGWGG